VAALDLVAQTCYTEGSIDISVSFTGRLDSTEEVIQVIEVEIEEAEKQPGSGVKVTVLVNNTNRVFLTRVSVVVPSYVVTELLDAAGVEYTTKDE